MWDDSSKKNKKKKQNNFWKNWIWNFRAYMQLRLKCNSLNNE